MKEIWKDIEGYEGKYRISNLGRVLKINKYMPNRYMANVSSRGYCRVNLSKCGKNKKAQVHRVVAMAFIPNAENKPQVNHINGIKHDNRVVNLEWCTQQENMDHAYANNLIPILVGEDRTNKLKTVDVLAILDLIAKGVKDKELSKTYKVDRKTIGNIRNNKSWKHIDRKSPHSEA